MAAYLKLVLNLIPTFEKFELARISRCENSQADALSKLASSKYSDLLSVADRSSSLTFSNSSDKPDTLEFSSLVCPRRAALSLFAASKALKAIF